MNASIRRLLSCLLLAAVGGCAGAAVEGANMTKDEVVYRNHIEAARAGDTEAEFRVGEALCCSVGDSNAFYDTRESVEWLCRAARKGHAPASRKLGRIYAGDVVDGVRLLRRVAEGVAGRQTDTAVAYAWLRIAASRGEAEAAEEATALWSDLDEAEKTRARALLAAGSAPLRCRWNEVFPG